MKKLFVILLIFSGTLISQPDIDTLYYLPDSAEFIYDYAITGETIYQHTAFTPIWKTFEVLEIHYMLSPSTIGDTIHTVSLYKDKLSTILYSQRVNAVIDNEMVYPNWFIINTSGDAPVFTDYVEVSFYLNDFFDLCISKECFNSGNSTGFEFNVEQWRPLCDPPVKLVVRQSITGIDEYKLPDKYYLAQNYPNPFNPTTKIKYAIAYQQYVSLKIYDILGNEIATLVTEEKPAGEYEVEFSAKGGSTSGGDGSHLASGIYFYTLRTGNFVQTMKTVLVK